MNAGSMIFFVLSVLLLGSCDAIPAPGRVTTCLAQKFEVIVGHTACLAPSPYIIDKGVSQEDKERIVNLHNEYRGAVPAANMQKMVWDEELSEIVQKWTDNCEYHHDGNAARSVPGRFSVGQNLALGHADWASVIRAWNDEIKYFTYGSADNVFGEIGHFTQVVWAESSKVGCAYTVCENLVGMSFNGKYWACNYGPGGNSADTINTPYKLRQKDACEDCPDTCDALTGLCDCGGKVCQNGGTLDVNTCQCSCSKSFHEPEQCGVNCTAAMDPSYCQTQYNKEYCAVYANVPYDCPNMCDVCPYAGIDYTGPPQTSPPAIADVGETQSQGKQTNPAPTDPKPPEAVPTKKTGEETTPTEYDQEKSTTAPDGRQEGTTQEDDEVSGTPRTDPTVENVEPVTGTGSNEYRPVTIDYKDLSDQSGTWPPTTEEDEQQNIAPTTTEVPKPWGPKGDNMAVTFTVPFGLIISTYAVCLIF